MMASFKRAPYKQPLLDPTESAALRDIPTAKPHTIARLNKLGLVEQKAGVWVPTHQGQIELIFGSAR
jgi:hypothetical protein